MDQRSPKALRLTRKNDIDRVFREGRSAADGCMTLFVLPSDLAHARLGVAVSRRYGCAVRRNRIKRLCREAFRLIRHDLPPNLDYMIVPRCGREAALEMLQASLRALAARLAGGAGGKGPRQ